MLLSRRSIRHFVVSVPSSFFFVYLLCSNNLKPSYCFSTPTPSTSTPPPSTLTTHRHDSNYLDILASGAPLLDVRAPIEYIKGSFPTSINHPLLNDEQRELIGTCYNKHGQEAAISLGYELLDQEDNLKETLT